MEDQIPPQVPLEFPFSFITNAPLHSQTLWLTKCFLGKSSTSQWKWVVVIGRLHKNPLWISQNNSSCCFSCHCSCIWQSFFLIRKCESHKFISNHWQSSFWEKFYFLMDQKMSTTSASVHMPALSGRPQLDHSETPKQFVPPMFLQATIVLAQGRPNAGTNYCQSCELAKHWCESADKPTVLDCNGIRVINPLSIAANS